MKTVWIYESGDVVKSFDSEDEARAWFKENDPEGVAFKHELSELRPAGSADRYGVPRATESMPARPMFHTRKIGAGYVIEAVWPDDASETVAGLFETPFHAAHWVNEHSEAWLRDRAKSNVVPFRRPRR